MKYILALDLGTTGNRCMAFSKDGRVAAQSYSEFRQIFPKPGWVEHDPLEIWQTTLRVLKKVVTQIGVRNIEALGITNQRETTILWNRKTGKPVHNAIVWQDRRTAGECQNLSSSADEIKKKTGLSLDPYFSATKIQWILEHVKKARRHSEKGEIIFGTVDSWILWQLTLGKVHATDASNASRTLIYNIRTLQFDRDLLRLFGIPSEILPEVKASDDFFGSTSKSILGQEIPITGILGDQQASFFAHGGWRPGVVKNTYGTGLFLMSSTGDRIPKSGKLINTIAWQYRNKVQYALEGSVFVGGAAIQWLRDGLKIIDHASQTEEMAKKLSDNEGVYFVPALAGLGAPYWDSSARGLVIGLTRGTRREHLARAALESLAYQTRDVLDEMREQCPSHSFEKLRVDGGAVKNDFLLQFQADILGVPVERPRVTETTALGVAGMAAIAAGFWTEEQFLDAARGEKIFRPKMSDQKREKLYHQWKNAVQRSLKWILE